MWNVILVLFAEFKLWMLVFDSSQKLRLTLEEEKIVLLSGGNAIIRFTSAVCLFGLNRIIGVHCVSSNGPCRNWENKASAFIIFTQTKIYFQKKELEKITFFTDRTIF